MFSLLQHYLFSSLFFIYFHFFVLFPHIKSLTNNKFNLDLDQELSIEIHHQQWHLHVKPVMIIVHMLLVHPSKESTTNHTNKEESHGLA